MADILRPLGVMIYVALTIVDKFVVSVPDVVYIPLALAGIGCLIAGAMISRKSK